MRIHLYIEVFLDTPLVSPLVRQSIYQYHLACLRQVRANTETFFFSFSTNIFSTISFGLINFFLLKYFSRCRLFNLFSFFSYFYPNCKFLLVQEECSSVMIQSNKEHVEKTKKQKNRTRI